ncbi:hypothetical protein [Pseudoxanthomonas dokdonensis]|uniref:Lipoprotein n=1 Tax=Pseudoxanthomonas dokdonensis TaxID=344882 RepID=A0A0R0CJN2_9GAMM|nr:hypothetical protein [Pseudoxanthomonas dokdonensis]KRG70079.1 hypothetical protein ABB29_07580 [Pseudoxanthomonas dokdonensis]
MRVLTTLFTSALTTLLALAGCDESKVTSISRSSANGIDLLYSKVTLASDGGNFECLASASGQCHYAVFARQCDHPLRKVLGQKCPLVRQQQFSVAAGKHLRLPRVQRDSQVCVQRKPIRAAQPCAT